MAVEKQVSETTPLVKAVGREREEQDRVLRQDNKKMDEFDSGGQAPLPDDEGKGPPLPEKV